MCRLFGLVADRAIDAAFGLLDARNALCCQARRHPHGWGIGYYDGAEPIVRKQPVAAEQSLDFARVARQARSHMFVAHVRRATAGDRQPHEWNTHPFRIGTWLLAQNGGIGRAYWHQRIKDEVGPGRLIGQTSGEHLLAWLHQRAGMLTGSAQEQAIIAALGALCARPAGIKCANFVIGTGDRLYAFCFAPPQGEAKSLFFRECGREHTTAAGGRAVVIASERLAGPDEQWRPFANGELLIADRQLRLRRELIGAW
jgi:glutamine amidotransferase